ncbi:pimeloyl-ACP methyl ester carboxylesterase [Nocardioides sp. J9]|uniref:alpha/beta fold hydrolase n=1 Tax=Nocardioides sp. J9 TaxID=935844 RepID=UPI0011A8ECFD|nr:alpha/beta hydrolase [Nocardioides sp. J9]TWH02679.1 pimeloyl-ACP methyl ester carboxylesterase [Nocardioides sp. J9]
MSTTDLFTDPRLAARLAEELAADARWRADARWLAGTIELRHDHGSLTVRSIPCEPPQVAQGAPEGGADFVVEAGADTWSSLLAGEADFLSGGPAGTVTTHGDPVATMHELRTLHNTLLALRRLAGTPTPAPSPAPEPTSTEVRGRYVDVDGLRVHVEETGDGVPVLCLHAAGQDTVMYRHVLTGLADRFRVIAVDAPGHGKSLPPPGGRFTSTTELAAFAERLIEVLELDLPVVLGCSMAGNTVLELGARRPDAYRAIVSAEGAAHTPSLDEFTLDMITTHAAVVLEPFARSLTGRRTPPDRAEEVVWQLCRAAPWIAQGDLTGYAAFDLRDRLADIAAPTLLLRGSDDWLVDAKKVAATAAGIGDVEVVTLDGTGHYPMIENPVEFNAAVRAFLDRVLDR